MSDFFEFVVDLELEGAELAPGVDVGVDAGDEPVADSAFFEAGAGVREWRGYVSRLNSPTFSAKICSTKSSGFVFLIFS